MLLFTSAGISAKSSTVTVVGTNVATGENIKGIVDESTPFVITFSDEVHPTYNTAQNVYLNNVQLDSKKVDFVVSGKTISLKFAEGILKDGMDYSIELSGLFDAEGNFMQKKVFKVAAKGEDKITETWKLNKGTYEKPDLLMFDGRVNGTIRGGATIRNMGFDSKTYGVKLVSKKNNVVISTTDVVSATFVSGEVKDIFTEINVTDDVDVYLHVVDEKGSEVRTPLKITTENVPEAAMLLDEYWGDSWSETVAIDDVGNMVNVVNQSGWVFDYDIKTQSRPTYANNNYFIFRDNDTVGSFTGSKKFLSQQKGKVTLDFEIGSNVVLNGAEVAVTGYQGNTLVDIVKLQVADNKVYTYNGKTKVELSGFAAGAWYPCSAEIDMDKGTFDLYYCSELVLDDADFHNAADTLSAFRVKTPAEGTGDLRLRYLYAYKGYYAFEMFTNHSSAWGVTDAWKKSGVVQISEASNSRPNDTDSLMLGRSTTADSGKIEKIFGELTDNTEIFFRFKLTGKNYFSVMLKGINDYYTFAFDVYETMPYFDGSIIENEKLAASIWHEGKFLFDIENSTIDFYVNDRKMASKVFAFSDSVLGICFEGEGGQLLDDIQISKIDRTTTVIDESQIPEDDGISVHMVFYPMWREGSHFGWDRITGYPERTPYLGYYDSGNVESVNMQIKWLVEHGVDAFSIPFSRAVGSNGFPIKFTNRYETIHKGYFESPYKDMIDFCLLYSGIAENSLYSVSDFKNNVVPYWIEHYFKHDNYAKTESGKAVFYMYTKSSFYNVMKALALKEKSEATRISEYTSKGIGESAAKTQVAADVKAEAQAMMKDCFDYLTQEVMKLTDSEGNPKYTGLYKVFVGDTTNSADYTDADCVGADALYKYGDPQNAAYKIAQLKKYNNAKIAQEKSGAEADYVPAAFMGYQRHPWDGGTSGGFIDPTDLEEVLTVIRDDINEGKVSPEKLVTLGCWDEFGEGHFFMPAEVYGFGYLDAVRNVFGDGSEHTDVKPSALEQRRFGWLYQNDGTGYRAFEWPENNDVVREVIKGWYFNDYKTQDITGSMAGGWKIGDSGWTVYNASSCEIVDGALKIVSNGNSPHLDYGYGDSTDKVTDIKTTDCKKFAVCIESNWDKSAGEYGLVYFSTEHIHKKLGYTFMQSVNGSCIVTPFRWNVYRNGYQDVELINNEWWEQDTYVKKLRYWPAYYGSGSAGEENVVVYLDSIEFLGNEVK